MLDVLVNLVACGGEKSIVRLSNLTKRKSSWTLKTHWDPRDRSITLCIEISSVLVYCQTLLDRHRLSTHASLMIRGSLRPSPICESKNQRFDEMGCRVEKISVGMGLSCPQEEEKTKKEVLL